MKLFREKFRVESTRMPGWDYRAAGHYFVTICTEDRRPFFGEILDGAIALSSIGTVVADEWKKIAVRRRDVELDEWVIMPNHVHAIVILRGGASVETPQRQRDDIEPSSDISSGNGRLGKEDQRGVSTARLMAGSLGALIGQFKSRATKRILRAGYRDFAWQDRFYDHIIRNDGSLSDIRQYVIENPMKWELDKDNVENLYM